MPIQKEISELDKFLGTLRNEHPEQIALLKFLATEKKIPILEKTKTGIKLIDGPAASLFKEAFDQATKKVEGLATKFELNDAEKNKLLLNFTAQIYIQGYPTAIKFINAGLKEAGNNPLEYAVNMPTEIKIDDQTRRSNYIRGIIREMEENIQIPVKQKIIHENIIPVKIEEKKSEKGVSVPKDEQKPPEVIQGPEEERKTEVKVEERKTKVEEIIPSTPKIVPTEQEAIIPAQQIIKQILEGGKKLKDAENRLLNTPTEEIGYSDEQIKLRKEIKDIKATLNDLNENLKNVKSVFQDVKADYTSQINDCKKLYELKKEFKKGFLGRGYKEIDVEALVISIDNIIERIGGVNQNVTNELIKAIKNAPVKNDEKINPKVFFEALDRIRKDAEESINIIDKNAGVSVYDGATMRVLVTEIKKANKEVDKLGGRAKIEKDIAAMNAAYASTFEQPTVAISAIAPASVPLRKILDQQKKALDNLCKYVKEHYDQAPKTLDSRILRIAEIENRSDGLYRDIRIPGTFNLTIDNIGLYVKDEELRDRVKEYMDAKHIKYVSQRAIFDMGVKLLKELETERDGLKTQLYGL